MARWLCPTQSSVNCHEAENGTIICVYHPNAVEPPPLLGCIVACDGRGAAASFLR